MLVGILAAWKITPPPPQSRPAAAQQQEGSIKKSESRQPRETNKGKKGANHMSRFEQANFIYYYGSIIDVLVLGL